MVTCFDLRDESLTFHRHKKTMKTWSWGSSVKSLIRNYWVGQLSVWLADKRAGVSANNHDTEKQNCAQMRSLSVARILSPVPRPWPFQVFVEGLPWKLALWEHLWQHLNHHWQKTPKTLVIFSCFFFFWTKQPCGPLIGLRDCQWVALTPISQGQEQYQRCVFRAELSRSFQPWVFSVFCTMFEPAGFSRKWPFLWVKSLHVSNHVFWGFCAPKNGTPSKMGLPKTLCATRDS